jgi:hypothetical protein
MSPLEYIEEGIKEGDWEKVCEGYERLTGKSLSLPVERPDKVMLVQEALQRIVNIASDVLSTWTTEIQSVATELEPTKKKNRGRPKGSGKKKKQTTITEDGEDKSLQLDDDQKTSTQKEACGTRLITNNPDPDEIKANKAKAAKARNNKIKLNRSPTTTYRVECNECGTKFESNRPGGEMGQKCRKCLNDKKGRFI